MSIIYQLFHLLERAPCLSEGMTATTRAPTDGGTPEGGPARLQVRHLLGMGHWWCVCVCGLEIAGDAIQWQFEAVQRCLAGAGAKSSATVVITTRHNSNHLYHVAHPMCMLAEMYPALSMACRPTVCCAKTTSCWSFLCIN